MSYLVLARKWRPQSFDELIGQETVVRTLKNAIISEKVVHAYLFSGPRGVGKTSAARILAKALNCSQGPTANPCGECQNCRAITDGSSLDVLEIDGASNTGVDNIRELRENVKYAPSIGRYKIYIIDEVHMLSESAFNALLKTLEEPPGHVIFVFATTAPKKIPATILSRCQHHAFRRIPKGRIRAELRRISEAENINIKDAAVEMIARAADGSMRDALTILDQASSFSDTISEEELQTLLGLPPTDIILKLTEAILKGDISRNLLIIKELSDRGYDLRAVVKELVEHFRNLAIVKIAENPEGLLEFTETEVRDLYEQAGKVGIEELTLLMSQLLKLDSEVRSATNPRYTLELGLLRTSFVKGMTSIGELLKEMANLSGGQLAKTPLEQRHEWQTALHDEAVNEGRGLWQKTIEKLKVRDHLLACKLEEATMITLTDRDLTIGFNGGKTILMDSVKKNTSLIEDALRDITGQRLKLKIIPIINKQTVLSDPTVKGALELFNGTLLEIKPPSKNNQ